jgi:hypothetical protein
VPATTTPATGQSITLADLRTICADLTREYPAAGTRVEKAANIVLFRHLERSESGVWYVQSETDPDAEYIVIPGHSCNCQDHTRHGELSPCKHQLGCLIAIRAERLEAERGQPYETLLAVDGEAIPYLLTEAALLALDASRQRDAARCPTCHEYKQHGSLYCEGERCVLDAQRATSIA